MLIQEYVTGVALDTLSVPVKRGRERATHRYRWLCDVPLRDGRDAVRVNWLEIEIANPKGKVTYRNSFIPSNSHGRHRITWRLAFAPMSCRPLAFVVACESS